MQHGIVEGEPGIFPEPIARFMRGIGRIFDRGKRDAPPTQEPGPEGATDAKDAPDTPK
ncbi:MAG TPA: hypothetical protein VK611_00575 [Acidimicrobiales bacterium]|nr:hypothetical protein [Acidimicrobiales bacterium]